MTWKYSGHLAKRFVAPVQPSTKKIMGEISHKYYLSSILVELTRRYFLCYPTNFFEMPTRYPFYEVIAEALAEVIENLIKKSIGELSLKFTLNNDFNCTYYRIFDNHQKPIAALYFDFNKIGFENRLEQFWHILSELRLKTNDQLEGCVFSIGLWGLSKLRDFQKNKSDFLIYGSDHIIDTFKWYGFELDENLTMDIDNYIRYQNLPEDEKIEIADVLLGSAQSSVESAIRIKPQPQTPTPSHPSSD
jgi:hypothetical protein